MLVLIRGSIQKLVAKWEEDRRALYNWRKPAGYGSSLIGLVSFFYLWLERFESIGTIFMGYASPSIIYAIRGNGGQRGIKMGKHFERI